MAIYKTISLNGSETSFECKGANCCIRNDGTSTVYASAQAGITAGADGVLSIPAGDCAMLLGIHGTVYVLGSGSILTAGTDSDELVFKCAPAAGAAVNLLDNPDLSINQRGQSEYSGKVYCVDRWQCRSVAVASPTAAGLRVSTSEGESTAHAFILQNIESPERLAEKNVCFAVDITEMTAPAGMISVWVNNKAIASAGFTAAGVHSVNAVVPADAATMFVRIDGARAGAPLGAYSLVRRASLTLGGTALTEPLSYGNELLKCQRFYQLHSTDSVPETDLRPTMYRTPDITQSGSVYAYCADIPDA